MDEITYPCPYRDADLTSLLVKAANGTQSYKELVMDSVVFAALPTCRETPVAAAYVLQ